MYVFVNNLVSYILQYGYQFPISNRKDKKHNATCITLFILTVRNCVANCVVAIYFNWLIAISAKHVKMFPRA